jgi:hypothetical protein
MAQPSNVIYLPPGVLPPVSAMQQPVSNPGIPFDRAFFEQVLPGSVHSFCAQADCDSPIVELLTVDGSRHYVKGISGVSDSWVALHTQDESHDHAIQVFLPYQTIYRVEIHPEEDIKQRRLGFVNNWEPPSQLAEAPSAGEGKAAE